MSEHATTGGRWKTSRTRVQPFGAVVAYGAVHMRTLTMLLVAIALLLPASAVASTASSDGSTVTIVGGPESSDIVIGTGLFMNGIRDSAGITAGAGCSQSDPVTVACPNLGNLRIDADLGPGNDKIGALIGSLGTVRGGPGDDEINGDGGDNTIFGDEGRDILFGSNGNDMIDGGPGNDQIYGDGLYYDFGGSDTINSRDGERDEVSCGLGFDVVTADSLDDIYVECEQVDRGESPSSIPVVLPRMTIADAKTYVRRSFTRWYRAWGKGTHRVIAKPRRISRVMVRFDRVSVRYRGRTYRGWARARYFPKNGEVYIRTDGALR